MLENIEKIYSKSKEEVLQDKLDSFFISVLT